MATKKNINNKADKQPLYEIIAAKLIEQLQAGTAPWQQPWQPGEPHSLMPMNPTTGKRYKGLNAIHLMAQDRSDARWMTYQQAVAAGAQVRKGEKGTLIQYWKFSEEQDRLDEQGRPVRDENGHKIKETVPLERPRTFLATVFNAEQIDGLPPRQVHPEAQPQWDAVARAGHILNVSRARILHVNGDRAFYRPSTDTITLPARQQFTRADAYYATALHELGHWTGHESRLNRDLSHPFGSEAYAKEELRAEIASMMVGDALGIGHDPGQHAAYVASWIKVLKEDPIEIYRAASDAEKIHEYVLTFEHRQLQEHEKELTMPPINLDSLSGSLTDRLADNGLMSRPDAEVTRALRDLHASTGATRAIALQALHAASEQAFGFTLPTDWNGQVRIQGNLLAGAGNDPPVIATASREVEPHCYGVYARLQEGTYHWLADFGSEQQADELAQRLARVDAYVHVNAVERAQQLARVRRDPHSSDADILAAKETRQHAEMTAMLNDPEPAIAAREYIQVPYPEKDAAKALGARWDRQQQSWYVPLGVDTAPFAKWAQRADYSQTQPPALERHYLAVPYTERGEAKAAGALWDKAAKSWYAGPWADMARLERWQPEHIAAQQGAAMTPREEFAQALRAAGLFVGQRPDGDHPIMDGQKHRVPVDGGKSGAVDGFYVGHLDGHPAGRIINHKTGTDVTWKSKGYTLSDEESARLHAEAATRLANRAAEQEQLQAATAERVGRQVATLVPVEQPTPYLQAKGIQPQSGVLTDSAGQKTYIPAFDAEGKQWTMQYIQADGTKRFAKDSKKEGCFHPVGGMDALAVAPALVISEGYATAASNAEALGFATVAAFDSGNLPHVARALHEKFPDKPIIIAGDDDKQQEIERGHNPGRAKAEEAAQAVGGKAIFPIFAPGEQAADPKGFTDFNDLANKSELGREGIKRQVNIAVGKVLIDFSQEEKVQKLAQEQKREQKQEQRPRRAIGIG